MSNWLYLICLLWWTGIWSSVLSSLWGLIPRLLRKVLGLIGNVLSGRTTENYSPGATHLPTALDCSCITVRIVREDTETRKTDSPSSELIVSLGIQYAMHAHLNNAMRKLNDYFWPLLSWKSLPWNLQSHFYFHSTSRATSVCACFGVPLSWSDSLEIVFHRTVLVPFLTLPCFPWPVLPDSSLPVYQQHNDDSAPNSQRQIPKKLFPLDLVLRTPET